jgi:hypothetical protein
MTTEKIEIRKKKTFLQRKREALQIKRSTQKENTSSEVEDVKKKLRDTPMEPSTDSSTNIDQQKKISVTEEKAIAEEAHENKNDSVPVATTSKPEAIQIKSPIKVKGLPDLPKLKPLSKSASKKSDTLDSSSSIPKGQVESARKIFEPKATSSSTESAKDSFQDVSKTVSGQLENISKTRPKPPRTTKILTKPVLQKECESVEDPKNIIKVDTTVKEHEEPKLGKPVRPQLQRSVTMEIEETESEDESETGESGSEESSHQSDQASIIYG